MSQPPEEIINRRSTDTEILIRLVKLEQEVSRIEKEITDTTSLADDIQESLENLESNLSVIKYVAIGAGGMLLVKNFGLSVVLQKLLGLAV